VGVGELVAGRRVVVTGGSPICGAVAAALAGTGARVATIGPDGTPTGGTTGAPVVAHVTSALRSEPDVGTALAEATAALGGLDQLVHAWVAPELVAAQRFEDVDEDTWVRACEGTLEVAWWTTRQVIAPLRAAGGGSIVYLVPTVGMSGAASYSMLATAVEGIRVLGKGCARHWGKDGVSVTTVATAPEHWIPAARDGSLHRAISLAVPAMGGAGEVDDDLVPLVALLGSPEAHFWTAGTVVADGGVWMGL
jgi:hypothetical protein